MHIILLRFGENASSAPRLMADHNAWIGRGFADGVFQCVGSLEVGGGFILASDTASDAIQRRVDEDPFVAEGVVTAEIHAVDVKHAVPALEYLASTA